MSRSLPGGDPLAEALAAGETPSPEMVAAGGSTATVRPVLALCLLVTAATSIGMLLWLTPKLHMLGQLPLDQGPQELRVRARDTIRALGYPPAGADSEIRFGYERGYPAFLAPRNGRPDRPSVVRALGADPAPLFFTYEQSPTPFLRESWGNNGPVYVYGIAGVGPGLVSVDLHLEGRLRRFVAIPTRPVGMPAQERVVDWDPVFRAAGLDRSQFTPVKPAADTVVADTSAAWTGTFPTASATPVRIEAAALHGQITEFEVRFPWSGARRRYSQRPFLQAGTVGQLVNSLLPAGLAFLAWVNWKRGRADLRSAVRMGVYAFAIVTAFSLLTGASPIPAVAAGVFFFTMYVAVEPWSRRMWPHAMVTWTRVLGGRFRDPLVGRDVLVVVACVTFDHAVQRMIGWSAGWYLEPGSEETARFGIVLESLLGGRSMIAMTLAPFVTGIFVGVPWFAVLLLAKTAFKKTWLAAVTYFVFFVFAINGSRFVEGDWPSVTVWCLEVAFLLFLSLRFGLFAASLFSALSLLINRSMLTYEFGAWYGQASLVATVLLVAFALYGFFAALGGRPVAALAGDTSTWGPEGVRP